MSELGDVLELLHGAHRRFTSVRATIREWHHHERSERAFARFAEGRGGSIGAVFATRSEEGPPPPATETVVRLWWEPPDRLREEREEHRAGGLHVAVARGERWWIATPGLGSVSNEEDPDVQGPSGPSHSYLFDPARLLGVLDLEVVGPASVAGRSARRLRALPRAASVDTFVVAMPLGADDYDLDVDAERGVVLRVAARIGGEEFVVVEILEVAFDESFPPGTFEFVPPPGEVVRSPAFPLPREISIDEAAREAPFAVFLPRRVPGDAQLQVTSAPADPAGRMPHMVTVAYLAPGAAFRVSLTQSPVEAREPEVPAGAQAVERGGLVMRHVEMGGQHQLWLDREGTRVFMLGDGVPLETLVEMMLSLEPPPTDPPRLTP